MSVGRSGYDDLGISVVPAKFTAAWNALFKTKAALLGAVGAGAVSPTVAACSLLMAAKAVLRDDCAGCVLGMAALLFVATVAAAAAG